MNSKSTIDPTAKLTPPTLAGRGRADAALWVREDPQPKEPATAIQLAMALKPAESKGKAKIEDAVVVAMMRGREEIIPTRKIRPLTLATIWGRRQLGHDKEGKIQWGDWGPPLFIQLR